MSKEYDPQACRALAASTIAYAVSGSTIFNDFKHGNRTARLKEHLQLFSKSRLIGVFCAVTDLDEVSLRKTIMLQALALGERARRDDAKHSLPQLVR